MDTIWIVTHVEESDGIASTAIVSENKVVAYFRSEADDMEADTDFDSITRENGKVDAAMLSFESEKEYGDSYAFSVMLGDEEHHFQKLSGALYPMFLNDADFLTLKSLSK